MHLFSRASLSRLITFLCVPFFFYSFFLCSYVVLHKKKNKVMMDYINGKVDNDTSF